MKGKKLAWLALIPAVVLVVGIIAAFVRVQTHADDNQQHVTRHELQEDFVPRNELDHRLDAQMRLMEDIHSDVKDLKQDIRDLSD
jgi:hypothetical protein